MSYAANPRAPKVHPDDAPQESTGPIAKDSLAADSIRAGGEFSENTQADILGVKGSQSTLANEDNSNADILHAARSGAVRAKEDEQGLGSDERGTAGGIRYPSQATGNPGLSGTHSDQGYRGDTSYTSTSGTGTSDDFTSTSGGGTKTYSAPSGTSVAGSTASTTSGVATRPYVDQAPNYTADLRSEGDLQPKGSNLTEGGDIPPNRSTFTGDVGGAKDPGRLAERNFQNSDSGGIIASGVLGDRSGETNDESDKGGFENLNSSERA